MKDAFLEKLTQAEKRFSELEARLEDPSLAAIPSEYTKILKEYHGMSPLIEKFREYRKVLRELENLAELAECTEKELASLAEAEYPVLKQQAEEFFRELQIMLLPRDPNDEKNVMMEIRAGTGGEEAALFVADLYRMYSMYAQSKGFRIIVESANPTEIGGYKEIVFMVTGAGAYSRFKFESGIHRVQRVPVTGAADKLQTSAATVAVLPEADEISVSINPADLIFESCKSSGAGGQHINKTESAVRLTHKPSGIVVECQEERSQLQNKNRALEMLRTKLLAIQEAEAYERVTSERRSQVGSGDRSAKIRTYNFPQNRVTDHRIGFTSHALDAYLNGRLDELIDALISFDTATKLEKNDEG